MTWRTTPSFGTLEIIGEAANRLAPETRTHAPEIEWHRIERFGRRFELPAPALIPTSDTGPRQRRGLRVTLASTTAMMAGRAPPAPLCALGDGGRPRTTYPAGVGRGLEFDDSDDRLAVGALVAGSVLDRVGDDAHAAIFSAFTVLYLVLAGVIWYVPETAPRHAGLRASLLPRASMPGDLRAAFLRGAPAVFAGRSRRRGRGRDVVRVAGRGVRAVGVLHLVDLALEDAQRPAESACGVG